MAPSYCRPNSGNEPHNTDRDPFPEFIKPEVQSILKQITGYDIMKLAGPHIKPLSPPKYKLLTNEELAQEKEDAYERLKYRLQMPPYMNSRRPQLLPLSDDPDLAGFDTSKYVFTDISFGIKDTERSVVVRDIDGSLKIASVDVKERMNEIYNPREGRSYITPQMFQEQNIERLIREKKYLYILERACAQFEPDDPIFVQTCHRVYSAVDSNNAHDLLRSTRFFGPMAFYLVWTQNIDLLLMDMLQKNLTSDAVQLIRLFCCIHADCPCAIDIKDVDQSAETAIIQAYIDTEARLKNELELALQSNMLTEEKSV